MAPRNRLPPPSDEDMDTITIEGAQFEDVTKIRDDQAKIENEINAELGSADNEVDYEIKVYRVPATGKNLVWLFSLRGETVAGLNDRLKAEYGNGKYTARVYKNAQLYRALSFEIELPKNTAPQMQMPAADTALAMAVKQIGDTQAALVAQLAAMKQAAPAAAPAIDPIGMMTGIAAMMKEMRELMPPPPKMPTPPNPMEFMKDVIGMAKDLNDEGREKSVIDLVGEFLKSPIMETVLQNAAAVPQQPQIPQAQIPNMQKRPPVVRRDMPAGTVVPQQAAPQMQQPAPQPAPEQAPMQSEAAAQFAANLAYMVTRAKAGSDPVLYADWIEDNIAPEYLDALLQLPNPLDALTQANPEVATYREWFASVIEALTEPADGVDTGGALDHTAEASRASGSSPAPVTVDGPA